MKNKLINAAIMLCFVVGLLLIAVNPIQNFLIERATKQLVSSTITVTAAPNSDEAPTIKVVAPADAKTKETEQAEPESKPSYDFEEVQSLSIWDVLEAQSKAKNMPAIGSIYIPSVDMTLPILSGVGKYELAVGAGTMKRDQQMGQGNYALASHYIEGRDVLFGPLYRLKKGESIYVTDTKNVYEYKTTNIKVIQATDVHVIDTIPGKTLLTLITCAEKGSKRLSVQGELISVTPAG